MKEKKGSKKIRASLKSPAEVVLSGYPPYPAGDDIYRKFHEIADLDPEEIQDDEEATGSNADVRNLYSQANGENTGEDLDVPGSDLDDRQEAIGAEDEENNYYSLGGDGHTTLDENQGE